MKDISYVSFRANAPEESDFALIFWVRSNGNQKDIYPYSFIRKEDGVLTTPTGKPVGFLLSSLACNRTSFSDFGIQV